MKRGTAGKNRSIKIYTEENISSSVALIGNGKRGKRDWKDRIIKNK